MFSLIVACNENNGIGKDNKIPWDCKDDRKFFAETTKNSTLLVGKNTWRSMGKLPNRECCVISSELYALSTTAGNASGATLSTSGATLSTSGATVYATCEDFIIDYSKKYSDKSSIFYRKHCFIAGGPSIYKWFTDNNLISTYYITKIADASECDVYYTYDLKCSPCEVIPLHNATVNIYRTKNSEENAFLALMKKCIEQPLRPDRTLTGCYSLFGANLSFDCSKSFPLLTTRRMFLRGVFEELMFMMRGETNSAILESAGVNAWKLNSTREFLDKCNLQHLPVGDIGPSYGFCMRYYGANYIDCYTNYTGQGFDQLYWVINEIKKNPTSRRLIINLYDPTKLTAAPLPPCLFCYQFYVSDGILNLQMTQRSSDIMIAGGWNIATGALLLNIMALECDLAVGRLLWNIGDVHVYANIYNECNLQLTRDPRVFPKLYINKRDILKYMWSDITLVNYVPHAHIATVQSA
jgi:thymidylate synthase